MKKNYTEIEAIIEKKLAELEEDWELDTYDINDIRLETYKANGWAYDPFPEGEEEEEENTDEEEEYHYMSMEDKMREVGMSWRDFF